MTRYRKAVASSLTAFTLMAAACGGSPAAPSDTTATGSSLTQLFAGSLPALGSSVFALTLVQASTVTLTLASITAGPFNVAAPAAAGLAFGAIDEAGACVHSDETSAVPALTSHLTVSAQAGAHCVEISDTGGLSGPVNFAVRVLIVAGTAPATTTAAGSDSFASSIPRLGSSSRAIPASQTGTITVNLTSLTPAGAVIGLGLGIPRADGGGCYLNASIDATTGTPPISIRVDPGLYCVRAFDLGLLTSAGATFTLTTAYP